MKVSIIIVNYNGIKYLENCINSCKKIDFPDFEIVTVDNASTDGSEKLCEHRSYCNMGLAWAQNLGAFFAKGDYLLFLNNDTLVEPTILTMLTHHYQEVDGVLGCRMGDYNGTQELDSFISVDRFGYPCGTTSNMFYPDGAIFISKKTFEEVGGFDSKLFLFGEDRDLCWRVWLAGHLCLPCTTAVFYHASSSVFGTTYQRRRIAERNMIRSMLKNYTVKSLSTILPQYILLSVCELCFLTLTGNIMSVFRCYIPAYWWNLVNIKDTLKERKKVQAMRKVDDSVIRKVMSRQIGKLFVLKKFGIPKFKERNVK